MQNRLFLASSRRTDETPCHPLAVTSLEPVISMQHVERLRQGNVLFRSHLDAGRRLVRLTLPAVLVHVPLATLSLLALMMTADGSAALVNQRFQPIGTSDATLLTWTVVSAAVALAGNIVVVPATLVIAAGHLVDRYVPPIEALRATVRRLPSLIVLLLAAASAFGTVWAARAGVLMATDQQWIANTLLVVAAYAAMPILLAVPGILLHGCSGLGSIRRAYRLTVMMEMSASRQGLTHRLTDLGSSTGSVGPGREALTCTHRTQRL